MRFRRPCRTGFPARRLCRTGFSACPNACENTRAGLTLLEVVIALAIFLFSIAAIAQLLTFSSDRVIDGHLKSQATARCEAKLAEVLCGAEPLSSSGGSFSDDPNWNWQLNCSEQGTVPNLWNVQVTVERKKGKNTLQVSLSQLIMAPSARGSTLVDLGYVMNGTSPSTGSASGSSSSSSSKGGMTGGGGGGSTAKGGTAGGGGTAKGGTGAGTGRGGTGTGRGGAGTGRGGAGTGKGG